MLSSTLVVALAGAATAFTPAGFAPVAMQNLTVAFGNTLAINGKLMTKEETAKAPIIGTQQRLSGTYAVMMVDPDIPPQTVGGPTGQLLHWMQQGMVSSNQSTNIGGVQVFELVAASNQTAFAPYFGPSPPNKAPNVHRYTQLLLNTTDRPASLVSLQRSAMTRTNFSAAMVISAAGLTVLAGNSFDVQNGTQELVQSNITKTTPQPAGVANPSGAATPSGATNSGTAGNGTAAPLGAGSLVGKTDRAYFAGLAALAAAILLL